MKVFISWSGTLSNQVADLLREMLPCVLQVIKPWMSKRDLDRGTVWFEEIEVQLSQASHGILVLTRENKDRPWVLFDAGALKRGDAKRRLYTILVDLNLTEVSDPLRHFHHTTWNDDEIFEMFSAINRGLGENKIDDDVFQKCFRALWPQFDRRFQDIIAHAPQLPAPTPPDPVAVFQAEMLGAIRQISARLNELESIARPTFVPYITRDAMESTPLEFKSASGIFIDNLLKSYAQFRTQGVDPNAAREIVFAKGAALSTAEISILSSRIRAIDELLSQQPPL